MMYIVRLILYLSLFTYSVVLLGLTGYRIHYTKSLGSPGDILTTRSHFYDPIIVELLVTSCLAIIFSLWFISAILGRIGRGPMGKYSTELLLTSILFIMFLVGASIQTHKWSNLKWCRGSFKVCRILETIKAFSHICWITSLLALLAMFGNMAQRKTGLNGPLHGRDDYGSGTAYPETRETRRAVHGTAPATTAGTGTTV